MSKNKKTSIQLEELEYKYLYVNVASVYGVVAGYDPLHATELIAEKLNTLAEYCVKLEKALEQNG